MMKHAKVSANRDRTLFTNLEELPNIGPAIASDLRTLGISKPQDLIGLDPYQMYGQLCRITNVHHDPCLLDTFIAAVRFMGGEPAKPWWAYTKERKHKWQGRTKSSVDARAK